MQDNKTKEYILDNGLKVLLNSYIGAPSATFMVWYRVGSRNEQPGKTGISHFLEHLSFKRTDLFEKGQIVAEITRNGGAFNAYTSRDFTCYYETFSTNKLELAMIIESQRMSRLVIEDSDRDKEVGIILSELEKSLDNPYMALDTELRKAAYCDHPYRNPVIGYDADIEGTTADDLRRHYESYYAPNNAVIVIAGNFDPDSAIDMIRKYFEKIPQRDTVYGFIKEKQQKELRRVVVERAGSSPIIKIAYHVPPAESKDIYPLIVLSEMLNSGLSSRMHQSLVETQIATDVSVNVEVAKDPGLFSVMATLYPNISHSEAEHKIISDFEEMITSRPPTDDELQKTKRRIKSSFEFNKDGTYKLAYLLGYYEIVHTYKFVETYLENINSVTTADIQRVIKRFLVPSNCTIGFFVPSTVPHNKPTVKYDYTPEDTVDFIYTNPPVILDEPVSNAPVVFDKRTLFNGIKVLATQNSTSDTVKLFGTISAGNLYAATVNPLLPVMCAGMLNRGSESMTKIQIAEEVEERGASVGISNVGEAVNFSLSSTAEDFPYILSILAKILMEPAFTEDEFEKYKKFALAGVAQRRDDAAYLASIAFGRTIYPKGHVFYPHTLYEQQNFINEITLDSVKSFYKSYYSPHTVIMGVSGSLASERVFSLVDEYFGQWQRKEIAEPVLEDTVLQTKYIEKEVKIPDKTEVEIIFGHYGSLARRDDDFHRANVMNFILGGGGALSSRIGKKIREDLGLVYSISSSFSALMLPGSWSVKFGVDGHHLDKAIEALKFEVGRFIDYGISEKELEMAKNYLTGSYPLRFASNAGIAKTLLINEFYGLGDEYLNDYPEIINAITREQVNETAYRYLHPDKATVIKAGTFL